jgi:hypothetical protein
LIRLDHSVDGPEEVFGEDVSYLHYRFSLNKTHHRGHREHRGGGKDFSLWPSVLSVVGIFSLHFLFTLQPPILQSSAFLGHKPKGPVVVALFESAEEAQALPVVYAWIEDH